VWRHHSGLAAIALGLTCAGCNSSSDLGLSGGDAGYAAAVGRDAHESPPDGGFAALDSGTCAPLPTETFSLVDYLLGPGYSAFHAGAEPDPDLVFDRGGGGRFCFGNCDGNAVDWAGFGGQTLLSADNGSGSIARLRFTWSKHQGHGGSQFSHLYLLAPIAGKTASDSDSWFTAARDPSLDVTAWKSASPALDPVAVGRGRVTWSNNGLVAFRSGLVGSTGSGNNSDDFAFAQIGPGKVPSAVAVTNNSEIALVTVWDAIACKSELAVFALTQRDGYLAGLPSEGFFSSVRLLGSIDLPIARPTRVSASVDFSFWMGFTSKDSVAELSAQAGRDKWAANTDDAHSAARAGYALVASRDEGKIVFVDLEPLFQSIRTAYFSTSDPFAKALDSFDVAPRSKPTVAFVLDVDKPAAVATGFPVGDRSYSDADFAKKAYVATVDGTIFIYDVGALASVGTGAAPTRLRTLDGCKNPTNVAYGRGGASRDGLAFACRGDRAVLFVEKGGDTTQLLRDRRINDPVAVAFGDSRGASVVSVADFSDRQVLSYLIRPIDSWGERLFGGLGADGNAQFELTGIWLNENRPFALSSAMIP
jgi:hypothetical protein